MRLTGTIRVDLQSDSPEASEFLLKSIVRGISPNLSFFAVDAKGAVGKARVLSSSITRVRPARSKSKAQRKR